MVKHLYLDLEDTVITPVTAGWLTGEIITAHIATVRKLCQWADRVSIFSFAVGSASDRDGFREIQKWLEDAIGCDIAHVPTCDEIQAVIATHKKFAHGPGFFDFDDMCCFYGKEGAFDLWIKKRWLDGAYADGDQIMLLDDTIEQTSERTMRNLRDSGKGITILHRSPFHSPWLNLP